MSVFTCYVWTLAILTVIYTVTLWAFIVGLHRLRRSRRVGFEHWPSISVVVPARNEAEVLERTLRSLLAQDYPGPWEVIVVDDRSTDDTPQLLGRLQDEIARLRSLRVTSAGGPSPKKTALALGIQAASGELLVTTDADCQYDPAWLKQMVSHLAPDVGVVAGLTVFDLPAEWIPAWQRIQWLDFFVQNFLAAGAAGLGMPSSCNGSNLLYRREVYDEIAGFSGMSRVVSGDDVLFAQRVSQHTKWKIVFSAAPETVVRSLPVLTVRELVQQRLRWASKGLAYRWNMLAFLLGIYGYYLLLLSIPVAAVLQPTIALPLAAVIVWKWVWDYITVRIGCRTFGRTQLQRYFLPYAVLQTIFYPFFGIAGLLMPYRWKGDWYRTARLPRALRRSLWRMRRVVRARGATSPH